MNPLFTTVLIASCAVTTGARGQNTLNIPAESKAWQACADLTGDSAARLACFDQWAQQQLNAAMRPPSPGASALAQTAATPAAVPAAPAAAPVTITMTAPAAHDCKSKQFSELSRFWELEAGSDCGTFGIRGFHPISLAWISSDSVNTQPNSPVPDHTATTALGYQKNEVRIQLSVRTKVAQGLLTGNQELKRDSIWFGYSQQSNWQIFSGDLSRPFRTTDHEPEVTYIYPTDFKLPLGWRWRYTGLSLVHQSNGQPLPLSRSWNRNVLMAGMENGNQFRVGAKLWKRVNEGSANDDNPDIIDKIGRAEVAAFWTPDATNTYGLTLRHSLRSDANGSLRLEWLKQLSTSGLPGSQDALRFHTQLFSGYGDSLVDYNRRRTVLSIGLSLVDW
ncbi:MAG: phospholipase A [Rhodoferax sp.]|uniref:phospholipase A n=1 Tax=Rhodoferax sp. TaxID=50421 RepID=UPI0013FE6171|nr:phospholipase A [Rhodoferax sp.]NDP40982.1 phospholipase A [Rhodoferax sp.]